MVDIPLPAEVSNLLKDIGSFIARNDGYGTDDMQRSLAYGRFLRSLFIAFAALAAQSWLVRRVRKTIKSNGLQMLEMPAGLDLVVASFGLQLAWFAEAHAHWAGVPVGEGLASGQTFFLAFASTIFATYLSLQRYGKDFLLSSDDSGNLVRSSTPALFAFQHPTLGWSLGASVLAFSAFL